MLYGYVSFLLPQSAIARTGRNCSRTRSFLFGSVRCGVLDPNSIVTKTAAAFGKSRMHFIALILHGRRSFFPKRKINRQYISSNISVPIIGLVVAQWVGGSIALLFHNHGTRMGWVVSSTPRPLFTPGKDPVTIVQEAVWAPRAGLDDREISTPPGFDPRTVQPVVGRYTD